MKGVKAPLLVFTAGMIASFFTYAFTENLSTAVIIAGICAVLIFIVHPKTKEFVILAAVFAVIVVILLLIMIPRATSGAGGFRAQRILVWTNPEAYAEE